MVVEWQGRAILDTLRDGILAQVALVVLAAEGLEGALAIDGLIHRGAGETEEGGVGQTSHQEVAEIASGRAVGFVDEDVEVGARVEVRRHVAELVDHRYDDSPVIVLQQLVEPGDAAGVFQVAQAERVEVLEQLVFQLVAVDHEENGRFFRRRRAKKSFRRLDHGEGLAASLGVPDEAVGAIGVKRALDNFIHRAGLVLVQNVFIRFLVFLDKEDVVLQEGEHLRDGAEALHLGLQLPGVGVLPIENVPPYRVPGHSVGKTDGVGGDEELLGYEQLGSLAVVTTDLIHAESDRLVFVGVFAFDHQHRHAVDEEDHVLPRSMVTVVKGPLFGDFKNVARWLVVIDQDQVALTVLLLVGELAPVAQVLDKFPVSVDVGMEITEPAGQRAFGLGITRVELPHLGIEHAVEEKRALLGALLQWRMRIKPAPAARLLHGTPSSSR